MVAQPKFAPNDKTRIIESGESESKLRTAGCQRADFREIELDERRQAGSLSYTMLNSLN